jgi:hypothetical protein
MDRQRTGNNSSMSSNHSQEIEAKREAIRQLSRNYEAGKPMFVMEELFQMQAHIRQIPQPGGPQGILENVFDRVKTRVERGNLR